MSGIRVELKGMDEVLMSLDVKKFEIEISDALEIFGQATAQDAKNNLSAHGTIDRGDLSNSIGAVMRGPLTVEVFAHKEYAAYVEFGTRKFAAAHVATLPPNWQAFAAQFKGGRGGSFAQLLIAITEWVKRKGFAAQLTKSGAKSKSKSSEAAQNQAAYLIARKIMINGIKAQPYLFPAFEKNYPTLLDTLRKLTNA